MDRQVRTVLWAAVTFVSCGWASAETPERRFDNHRIVQVEVATQEQLDAIERLGGDILNCHPHPGPTDVLVTLEQIDELRGLGLQPRILQDDVQGAVDRQKLSAAAIAGADPFDDFFLAYHPYDGVGGVVWYMNELVSRYPTLASMVNVGTTLEGRTIWGVRITSTTVPTKPAVVYFGCEHAREWIASTVPTYLATYLVQNYGLIPEVTDLVDHVEFFLIPVHNVDGYVYTWTTNRFWRKNRRNNGNGTFGVDINRNWSEGWGGLGSSGAGNSETYRGPSAFSEPETRALRDFIIAHPNLRASLDVHSYSQLILWPYGYTSALSPDQSSYQDVGTVMRSLIYGVHSVSYAAGPVYTAIYPAAGVSVDWTYAQRDLFSFSYECRDTGFYGFTLPAQQIIPNNQELLPATLHMTNSDWVRSALRFEFPSGLPSTLPPGLNTRISVRIIDQAESVLPGSPRLHYRYDTAGPFVESPLSFLGGENYYAFLPATNCFSTPEYYFTAQTNLGTTVEKPRQTPAPSYYTAVMIGRTETFFDEPLNGDPGWSRTGSWAFGTPAGAGGVEAGSPDPTGGYTGDFAFGYNLLGDYPNNMPEHHLTTSAINTTGQHGVHLTFRRWLGVEQPLWDHAYVRVSTDGSTWTTVWQNETEVADGSWSFQDIDLSGVADNQPTVYLRWTMGVSDTALVFCGWNLDDVALYSTSCPATIGDFNGDGEVDDVDFAVLGSCYSGDGVAFGPQCRVFDSDGDGDVDCTDASAFVDAWTAPAPAPDLLSPCALYRSPAVAAAGARYLAITPALPNVPVALQVTLPSAPCHSSYVDFDPLLAARGVGRLVDAPVYRLGSLWGSVSVGDADIIPETAYAVRAQLAPGQFSPLATTTTMTWGDMVAEFGVVDALDIVAIVDRFKSVLGSPPVPRCDFYPSVPDYVIDGIDIVLTVDAFKGLSFPLAVPSPCPP